MEGQQTYSSAGSVLDSSQAWSGGSNSVGEYLQIDLDNAAQIVGTVVQGRADADEWVTSYTVQHSMDEVTWVTAPGTFSGNSDRDTRGSNMLQQTVHARYIRIYPQTWHGQMSMRAGVVVQAGKIIGKGLADRGKPLDVLDSCFEVLDVDVGEGG